MTGSPQRAWGAPLANLVASQAVWFLSLWGAGTGRHWLGSVALAAFVALQVAVGGQPGKDLRLGGIAALCGFALDTAYLRAGLVGYAAPLPWPDVAPYWIVAMWVNFGLTLDSCLRGLQRRPLLAAVLGAVGGPLAYAAGFGLGAAERLTSPGLTYGVLAIAWAIAVPAMLAIAARLPPRRSGDTAAVM